MRKEKIVRGSRARINAFVAGLLLMGLFSEVTTNNRFGWILILASMFGINMVLTVSNWLLDTNHRGIQ